MKTQDIFKFLLIVAGYYNNMKFDSWRCEDDPTCLWYEFSGDNDEEDNISVSEPGLFMAIGSFLDQIQEKKISRNPYFYQSSVKNLLDDEHRNFLIESWNKHLDDCKIRSYLSKECDEWSKENHPCRNCTLNDHQYPYKEIHNYCSKSYTMSCELLKHYLDEIGIRMRNISDRITSITEEERSEILNKIDDKNKTYD